MSFSKIGIQCCFNLLIQDISFIDLKHLESALSLVVYGKYLPVLCLIYCVALMLLCTGGIGEATLALLWLFEKLCK